MKSSASYHCLKNRAIWFVAGEMWHEWVVGLEYRQLYSESTILIINPISGVIAYFIANYSCVGCFWPCRLTYDMDEYHQSSDASERLRSI